MQSGLYVGLSSQIALEHRLTTISDNIANMNTTGFRATEVKFDQVLSQTKNQNNTKVAFVTQGNDYLSTKTGDVEQTGNSLDFAVKGDAWFQVQTPQGPVLTRDGRFSMSLDGSLVSVLGYPVLDSGGGPIQLDPTGGSPKVGTDGRINQNGRTVGQIGVFTADLSKGFYRTDNSGVVSTETPQPVVDTMGVGVMQGFLEQSNVNAIGEMTQLIQVNRAFESISSLMSTSEDTFSEAMKTLGGVTS
ncbi:flagellar basal-body rod protein FlgF [Neorhizobium sp. NCHU2750]|uniref:flagellar basal-body rod protein FlgF n=1 Tax=Neorhizobium sp. NCHU2750 TaxID=1825976 RepID=UPI000E75E108|nr:flagellar basal body rod protein [Neorhizobium sp. NCHU2750]